MNYLYQKICELRYGYLRRKETQLTGSIDVAEIVMMIGNGTNVDLTSLDRTTRVTRLERDNVRKKLEGLRLKLEESSKEISNYGR